MKSIFFKREKKKLINVVSIAVRNYMITVKDLTMCIHLIGKLSNHGIHVKGSLENTTRRVIAMKTIKPNFKDCPHCQFIATLGEVQSNKEYWLITKIFVHLHGGKDYCNGSKINGI